VVMKTKLRDTATSNAVHFLEWSATALEHTHGIFVLHFLNLGTTLKPPTLHKAGTCTDGRLQGTSLHFLLLFSVKNETNSGKILGSFEEILSQSNKLTTFNVKITDIFMICETLRREHPLDLKQTKWEN
jgi:hypothetical protein